MKRAILVFGLMAVGCGSESPSGPGNRPPVTPSIGVSPAGTVLYAVTRVTFSAQTSDPDGDPLTYAWQFNDNATATGATVTHTFASFVGVHTVMVTITDRLGATTTATTQVNVKALNGSWTDADPFYGVRFAQTGATCSGIVYAQGGWGPVSEITQCQLSHPRQISFWRQSFYPNFATCGYTGSLDESMDKMSVRCSNETVFTLKRD